MEGSLFHFQQTWSLSTGISQNSPSSCEPLQAREPAEKVGVDHSPGPFLPNSVLNRRRRPLSQGLTLLFAVQHHFPQPRAAALRAGSALARMLSCQPEQPRPGRRRGSAGELTVKSPPCSAPHVILAPELSVPLIHLPPAYFYLAVSGSWPVKPF